MTGFRHQHHQYPRRRKRKNQSGGIWVACRRRPSPPNPQPPFLCSVLCVSVSVSFRWSGKVLPRVPGSPPSQFQHCAAPASAPAPAPAPHCLDRPSRASPVHPDRRHVADVDSIATNPPKSPSPVLCQTISNCLFVPRLRLVPVRLLSPAVGPWKQRIYHLSRVGWLIAPRLPPSVSLTSCRSFRIASRTPPTLQTPQSLSLSLPTAIFEEAPDRDIVPRKAKRRREE